MKRASGSITSSTRSRTVCALPERHAPERIPNIAPSHPPAAVAPLVGSFPCRPLRSRRHGIPGRIPHDFRRTTVRNLERRGVAQSVAMKITGHKD